MSEKISKIQLIQLVTDIMNANGTEGEIDAWLDAFRQNVPHPHAIDLIFYSDRVAGVETGRELTPEEIVTIAVDYQPRLIG
jgi:Colicin immunity protein / pyocin immunity protein